MPVFAHGFVLPQSVARPLRSRSEPISGAAKGRHLSGPPSGGLRTSSGRRDYRAPDVLVHVADHGRTLADGRRAALDRAGAHVTGGINTRHARLEQPLRSGLAAGEDEPVAVARHDIVEPARAW